MIKLKILLAFYFSLILSSCKTENKNIQQTTETKIDTLEVGKKNIIVNKYNVLSKIKDSLYILKIGRNTQNQKFTQAVLYLDKISETEYGFVKVVKIPEQSPFNRFGILKSIDEKLYNVSHCTELDNCFSLMKRYFLFPKDKELAMVTYYSNSTDYFIWKPKPIDEKVHLSLRRTFKNTKAEYLNYKQKYLSYIANKRNKLNTVFEDDVWKTKHKHTENSITNHSYTIHKITAKDRLFLSKYDFELIKTEQK